MGPAKNHLLLLCNIQFCLCLFHRFRIWHLLCSWAAPSRRRRAGSRNFKGQNVRQDLFFEILREPELEADHQVLEALAESLADLLIARARREVAQERQVKEDNLDREHARETAQAISFLVQPFMKTETTTIYKGNREDTTSLSTVVN